MTTDNTSWTAPHPALPLKTPTRGAPRCEKTAYSKKDAQTAINAAMNRRTKRPKQLRSYHCPRCNAWHLTHQELHSLT